jgi:hypothetical protein
VVKKGRHRRFEEARDLKRALKIDEPLAEPCPECGASPGKPHASWCLATEEDDEESESANGYSAAGASPEPEESPGARRPPEP